MKLRHRLFLFSTSQLVAFGALFALAFWTFERSVVPMLEGLLRDKSEGIVGVLSVNLDVGLAAEDPKLLATVLARVEVDPDFGYVEVRDAGGVVVAVRGTRPRTDVFAGPADTAVILGDGIAMWTPISLEGLRLGSVAIVFSTARFATLERWARRFAVGVTVLWLVALGYSVVFARSFVAPIRAMMNFSRTVAGGALADRLEIDPPGELRDLRDYLNQMTADLEQRELGRQIAAARAEDMQRELLAVSRMAGMAEIATGVLHNVGNVLNSLNVSVSLIDKRVRNSRTVGLSRSIELFEGVPGGLPTFLATDKGKVFPAYLCSVSRRLVEDNAEVAVELASVTRNVDHIKSIVAMQQSNTRPTGMSERVDLASVIDDALSMSEALFARNRIEVVKHLDPGAVIVTDRHKLLQILVNLISNATQAVTDRSEGEQRLVVSARRTTEGAQICIVDTGVGILPENLAKIFQHGFTTKPNGHGFGLHASANTARELGGSLVVASAGLDAGATFTLVVPTASRSVDAQNN